MIPNGILATLEINLASMQPGNYVLSLGKAGFGITTLYNGTFGISPTLGQAQIVYVPEPLSAGLLSVGLLVLARRRS